MTVKRQAVAPLLSPTDGFRVSGITLCLIGLGVAVLASILAGPLATFVCLLVAIPYALARYVFSRRFVRRATEDPLLPRTEEREHASRLLRRMLVHAATSLPATLLLIYLYGFPAFAYALLASFYLGSGTAWLMTHRWLRAWEAAHHSRLLQQWPYDRTGGRIRNWVRPPRATGLYFAEPVDRPT